MTFCAHFLIFFGKCFGQSDDMSGQPKCNKKFGFRRTSLFVERGLGRSLALLASFIHEFALSKSKSQTFSKILKMFSSVLVLLGLMSSASADGPNAVCRHAFGGRTLYWFKFNGNQAGSVVLRECFPGADPNVQFKTLPQHSDWACGGFGWSITSEQLASATATLLKTPKCAGEP